MKLDVYTCSFCGKGFGVEENEQPMCCPFCQSDVFEYSHTMLNMPLLEDDVVETADHLAWAGIPDVSDQTKPFFEQIMIEAKKVEEKRWRKNPKNWGACCKWPYEDDLPF
jgi:hypothetical protein